MSMPASAKKVFHEGIVPLVSTHDLEVLLEALVKDDPRLLQGATTSPPPLQCVQDWNVEAACVIGYMGWQGQDLNTVSEVETFFGKMCFEMDQLMGEPSACRYFLNWADETPRDEMRKALIKEIDVALKRRDIQQQKENVA
jgi:hypothetical protein